MFGFLQPKIEFIFSWIKTFTFGCCIFFFCQKSYCILLRVFLIFFQLTKDHVYLYELESYYSGESTHQQFALVTIDWGSRLSDDFLNNVWCDHGRRQIRLVHKFSDSRQNLSSHQWLEKRRRKGEACVISEESLNGLPEGLVGVKFVIAKFVGVWEIEKIMEIINRYIISRLSFQNKNR